MQGPDPSVGGVAPGGRARAYEKLIYDKEEMTILRMQNNELRRMIGELQKDNEETKQKQVRTKY